MRLTREFDPQRTLSLGLQNAAIAAGKKPTALRLSRQVILEQIAGYLLKVAPPTVLRTAIDGIDGAGKTSFADELAAKLAFLGSPVIRASVDGFHRPKALRYARGRYSPEGFFFDSYDYQALKSALLDPLSPGGSRWYRPATFDLREDAPIRTVGATLADERSVLLLDGIFLHRVELRDYWDVSIFLDVEREAATSRMAVRDGVPPDFQLLQYRYHAGQIIYLSQCHPKDSATIVIDNNDCDAPEITKAPWLSA